MKNKFNDLFKDIKVSKEIDEKIYNKTIYKKEIPRIYILKPIQVILFIFIFLGVGVMAKDYIMDSVFHKNIIENEKDDSQIYLELNGKVHIKENNNFICNNEYTQEELEKTLGIKLLNIKYYNSNKYINCEIKTTDNNKIRTVKINRDDNYSKSTDKEKGNNKFLSVTIKFMTQYALNEDEEEFSELNVIKGPKKFENFTNLIHLNNLDVDAYIIKWHESKNHSFNSVHFVYNNILYFIQGYNISYDELLDILNNSEL